MKKLIALSCLLLMVGCTGIQTISEVKDEDNINLQVTIRGNVSSSVKLGELSGYTITDDTGSIFVSSDSLPAEGSIIIVTGELERTILGYYIETKSD
jgi:hypothetical protein